ncbi:hypothetical protein AAFF_G00320020 [Aldrovandia affinis]|uniref:Uncharacterized protein n=1 Tax=Aldrovandia affinis TaxID=143900 RepID=A0AAD7SMZ1_9TELE|nr:hypothetical protein AAFF_G00320020 [Aldrovandia affinis]
MGLGGEQSREAGGLQVEAWGWKHEWGASHPHTNRNDSSAETGEPSASHSNRSISTSSCKLARQAGVAGGEAPVWCDAEETPFLSIQQTMTLLGRASRTGRCGRRVSLAPSGGRDRVQAMGMPSQRPTTALAARTLPLPLMGRPTTL